MKRNHPVLESTITGIYVLDVESPIKKRDRIINVVGRLFLAGLFLSHRQQRVDSVEKVGSPKRPGH
jgi:hypothetical protein